MHMLSGPAQRRGSRAVVRLLSTAAFVAAMALSAPGAKAFSPELQELFDHLIDCKLLLLTDLQAHARECGGGTMPTSFQSLSEPVDGPPAPIVDLTPPSSDPEPPPPEKCEYPWEMPA